MGRFAKKNVTNVDELEKWLANERKIKFRESDTKVPKNVSYTSIYNRLARERHATYYVRGREHTLNGRGRSLHDLMLVYKFYKPNVTVRKILKDSIAYVKKAADKRWFFITLAYCPDIGKYNFRIPRYGGYDLIDSHCRAIMSDLVTVFPNLKVSDVKKYVSEMKREVEGEE
jgi:hypothetical protein